MNFRILVQATRAWSAPGCLIPALLGTALAARGGVDGEKGILHWPALPFVLAGAVLASFASNVLNDYFDFVQGVDTKPEHGSGVLPAGLMTTREALGFSLALFCGAAACGAFFLPRDAGLVVPLALLGLACSVLYSAWLKKQALGDVLLAVAFVGFITLGAYGVQTHALTWHRGFLILLYAAPIALLPEAGLHANNLRDAAHDRAAGVRTIANLLPRAAALAFLRVLLFGPFVLVAVGVLMRGLPVWSLAALLPAPLIIHAGKTLDVSRILRAHLFFGVLYIAALLLKPVFV